MKITKKTAKEIFNGNFDNVDFETLLKDYNDKGRNNKIIDKKDLEFIYNFNFPSFIKKKDFDGMLSMNFVANPNQKYGGKYRNKDIYTDVLYLNFLNGAYRLYLQREKSTNFLHELNIGFNKEKEDELKTLIYHSHGLF